VQSLLSPTLRRDAETGGGTNKPLLRALISRAGVRLIGILSRWEYHDLIGGDADYDRTQLGLARREITVDDVVRALAGKTGIPPHTIAGESDEVLAGA
jgi:hypothetical protein